MSTSERDAGDAGTGAPPPPDESNRAPDLTKQYANEDITIRWYAHRCIHSAECIRNAPGVFDPRRRPWIDLDGGDAAQIMRAIDACPTGALEYLRPADSRIPHMPNSVQMVPRGPLYVRGNFRIIDEVGNVLREGTRVALCRCGKTKNHPFCDNSHRAREVAE